MDWKERIERDVELADVCANMGDALRQVSQLLREQKTDLAEARFEFETEVFLNQFRV